MKTAKLFKHGGSQAVRLPKAFRFEGTEVAIEKRGSKLKTLADLARHMRERFPQSERFPDREQPRHQQKRNLKFD
jgi:antitoxin VapB